MPVSFKGLSSAYLLWILRESLLSQGQNLQGARGYRVTCAKGSLPHLDASWSQETTTGVWGEGCAAGDWQWQDSSPCSFGTSLAVSIKGTARQGGLALSKWCIWLAPRTCRKCRVLVGLRDIGICLVLRQQKRMWFNFYFLLIDMIISDHFSL